LLVTLAFLHLAAFVERRTLLANLPVRKGVPRQGTKNVARQQHVIARPAAVGADTAQAEAILETFQQMAMQQILNALDECELAGRAAPPVSS
jgi:hypothetical protein